MGLTGQFVEDCFFPMEYSVRTAQVAVYKLLNLDKQPTPFRRVSHDLHVAWNAFKALQQGPAS